MVFFEKIKKEIEKKSYKVYEVNLALDVVKNGIQFENFEKLQDFMSDQKINVIFFSKYYDNPYNYIITEETFRNLRRYYDYNIIDIISDDIDKHNKEILKIDFDEPSAVIVACIFEGQYCFVYLENDKLCNRKELKESEEKLYEIVERNRNRIDEKKMENRSIIEKLKVKVREKILKDEKFLLCTTKQLRKNYTRTLRHRHRFEYNNEYKERLEKAGLICSGTSPDGTLVEIVENKNHPFFIAGQFHPEFKSRPNKPQPLFVGLIKAAKANKNI